MYTRHLAGLTSLAVAVVMTAACADVSPTETALAGESAHFGHNAQGGADIGTTGGWFKGQEVTFFYNKDFFCKDPSNTSDAPSDCLVGAEPEVLPRNGNIPVLYVMAPLFTPSTDLNLQCPDESCINHPTTLDVTPIQGILESVLSTMLPEDGVIPTPAHSHIVDVKRGGWWEIELIGVTNEAAWNDIASAKSLDRVRELQSDPTSGVTGDIPSNLFLFFSVRP